MWLILNIILVLSSVLFWPFPVNDSYWVIKEVAFVIGVLAMVSYSYDRPRINDLNNRWLALGMFAVSLGFVYFFYTSFITANGSVKWNFWNFRPSVNILLGILLIRILYEYCDTPKRWIDLGKLLAWMCGIFSAYSILQYFHIDQIFSGDNIKWNYANGSPDDFHLRRMVTFFGNIFLTSNFIAMTAPMCLIFKGLRYKIFLGLACVALFLLTKAIATFALIVGLVVYLFMNRLWYVLGFLGLVSASIVYVLCLKDTNFLSFSGREQIWIDAWNWFLQAPFTGHGFGSYEVQKFMSANLKVTFIHNEFLRIICEGGLFIFCIYIGFILNIFRNIYSADKNILLIGYTSGLCAFLVICFGGFPFSIAPLALIGIIYIAGLLYLTKET